MQTLRLSFSRALALAALAIFSFGCNSGPAKEKPATPTLSAPTTENPGTPAESTPTTENPGTPAESTPTTENPTTPTASAPTSANPPQGTPTTAPTPAPTAQPAAPADDHDIPLRTLSENKIGTQLIYIAKSITDQKLEYRADLGQDCSGIYHRIKDSLQVRLPSLANKSKYIFPNFSIERSSRAIARWYHDHHNLHIVQNGKLDANRIHPGSVMFFSNTDKQYSNMDIDLLAGKGNVKGVIMHIAVVTSVEKDEAGNVIKYTMMHGRNTKYTASPTGGNCDCGFSTGKQHEKFPFGNYNQQWVAVANIETPAK